MSSLYTDTEIMPTLAEATEVVTAKLSYDMAKANKSVNDFHKWIESSEIFFKCNPRGIAWSVGPRGHANAVKYNTRRKLPVPTENDTKLRALHYFVLAATIGWEDLTKALKPTLKFWKVYAEQMRSYIQVWTQTDNAAVIASLIDKAQTGRHIKLIEAIETHSTLNTKLFNKNNTLKESIRKKLLEIVDEFLADLREQNIKIKVADILLIGSNASYNYTKDSDIDLHILADTGGTNYAPEVAAALYGAFRTLFNKQLDIKLFGIPVEIFVETKDSPRESNGVYSVKKDRWIKEPIQTDIPEYDKDALKALVSRWEEKCTELLNQINDDKLKDETKVIKLLEDIYEKLRKKGIAKSEYAVENLAFKELRNKGYLDKLKDGRNTLVSKRLSLEERLDARNRKSAYDEIMQTVGIAPIIQDNGLFFIYNLKESEVHNKVQALKRLPIVKEVYAQDSGKYDFSNVMQMALHQTPSKYYSICGWLVDELCE